jgi:hypothetical protein
MGPLRMSLWKTSELSSLLADIGRRVPGFGFGAVSEKL